MKRFAWMVAASVALTLSAAPPRASAQQADVVMSIDRSEAGPGEPLLLEIRINATNGRVESVNPPDLSRFTILGQEDLRPMQFSFSFGGGGATVAQSSVVRRYRLVAKALGRIELGPARVVVGGRTFRSNPLSVTIRDPSQAQQAPTDVAAPPTANPPGYAPPTGTLDGAHFDRTAFLRTVVDKTTAHVGEQVTATLYLYVHGSLGSSPEVSREATTDGFWVHDLTPRDDRDLVTEQTAGGIPFRVYLLKRMALFPLRAGTLTIGAMHLTAQTAMGFDTWGVAQPEAFDREGVAVSITVQDLPSAGRPSGDVYVGNYTIETRLDRPQAATGDAVTLTCVVRGSGNMRELRIELPTIPGLNILAPQVNDEVSAPSDLVGGSRTFEWLVVPQRAGTYTIPAMGFSVFDPQSDSYARVAAPALTLVAAGNPIATSSDAADRRPQPATPAAERVTFGPLHATSEFLHARAPLSRARWFGLALFAPPVIWFILVLMRLLQRRNRANEILNAPKRAVRGAKKRLAKADSLAQSGDARSFYTEVARAMKEVLEARLLEPVGGLTHAQLRQFLVSRGMQDELVVRIIEELEGGDFARFSSTGSSPEEMTRARERVEALLQRIDKFTPTPKDAP